MLVKVISGYLLPRSTKLSISIVLDLISVSNEVRRSHLRLLEVEQCQELVFLMEIYFTLCQPMAPNCGVLRRPVVPPITVLQVPMIHSHKW